MLMKCTRHNRQSVILLAVFLFPCYLTMAATGQLDSLRGADGSAVFSSEGISVLASINGPLEVQRRDEIPDEAAIEVNIRPAAGVGGMFIEVVNSYIPKLDSYA